MAVLAYTCAFCILVSTNNCTCRLAKIHFIILKVSFQVSLVSTDVDSMDLSVYQKVQMIRQTDRQTDRQTVFQLYIVSVLSNMWL